MNPLTLIIVLLLIIAAGVCVIAYNSVKNAESTEALLIEVQHFIRRSIQ